MVEFNEMSFSTLVFFLRPFSFLRMDVLEKLKVVESKTEEQQNAFLVLYLCLIRTPTIYLTKYANKLLGYVKNFAFELCYSWVL